MGDHRVVGRFQWRGLTAGLFALTAALVALMAATGGPAAAANGPAGCPTFSVTSQAQMNAAITCLNSNAVPGQSYQIDINADITYTGATVAISTPSSVTTTIFGFNTILDADGLDTSVIQVNSGTVVIDGLVLTGANKLAAFSFGGGVLVGAANVTIDSSTVYGNSAGNGGGIGNTSGSVVVFNSVVSGNTATTNGGGIHSESTNGTVDVLYSTVTDNTAPTGAGLSSWGSASNDGVNVAASIVADNNGTDFELAYETTTNTFTSGGYSVLGSRGTGISSLNTTGDFTLGALPLKLGALEGGLYHYPFTGSPAIDRVTGSPNLFGLAPPIFDHQKRARGVNGANDAGAIEVDSCSFVDGAISNGTSVVVASDSQLDYVINCFNNYSSSGDLTVELFRDITYSLDMLAINNSTPGLSLFLDGAGHTLDANGDVGGGEFTSTAAVITNLAGDVTLEDVTLRGGDRPGGQSGGGIENRGTMLLGNVTIRDNYANANGGGVSNGSNGTLNIENSLIEENEALSSGGGVYNSTGGRVVIFDSTIRDNTAGFSGGGAFIGGIGGEVWRSAVYSNTAVTGYGGGIAKFASSAVNIYLSSITENTAATNGGGISNENGAMSLVLSTISSNSAGQGGGIWNSGDLDLGYVTVSLNNASLGSGVATDGSSTGNITEVSAAIIAGNGVTSSGDDLDVASFASHQPFITGDFNVFGTIGSPLDFFAPFGASNDLRETDPQLDGLGLDNATGTFRHLPLSGSPVIDHVSGTPAAFLNGLAAVDQVGTSRPLGLFDDAGAIESSGVAVQPRLVVLAEPCVVYDSTSATGNNLSGTMDGGELRTIQVSGMLSGQGGASSCGVVPGSTAAVVGLSAIDPQVPGNFRLSASGVTATGGVVNFAANGLDNANTVTVPLGAGAVDLFVNTGASTAPATDARLIVLGYYVADASVPDLGYTPLTPCAVADTRSSQNPGAAFTGPFAVGANFPLVDVVDPIAAGQGGAGTTCGIPTTAHSAVVNVVAIGATGGTGFLSAGATAIDPSERTTPFAPIGMNNAAVSIIPLNGGDTIEIDIEGLTGSATTHVRVVVLGYIQESVGFDYTPVNPCAVFDTRSGTGSFEGKRDGGSTTTYDITGTSINTGQGGGHGGTCGVPDGAEAVLINLVAVGAEAAGNLRVYATGTTPAGGVLNFRNMSPAMNNSNAVVVPLSTLGQLSVDVNTGTSVADATHIRGVILGYYD